MDFSVFKHLVADKATAYRAVMHAFVEARERFALHLKPSDVLGHLRTAEDGRSIAEDEKQIEQLLAQLVEWGNLTAHADNSEVKTVEDFNKPRFLYQLSRAGEAAEQALSLFQKSVEQSGELQATALAEIHDKLLSLRFLLAGQTEDGEKAYLAFREIFDRFEVLTSRAQQFMGSIQRVIDLQNADMTTFLKYKEKLLDYIQRFIQELITKGALIAETLRAISAEHVSGALERAAGRDLADAIDQSPEAVERSRELWVKRWRGLTRWFIGDGEASQAAMLRARARSAIPDLLSVISSLNERRALRSDRAADYLTLARWFAECQSPEDAHALWRSAFCLTPVRHLALTKESLDEDEGGLVKPKTSWLDADPMWISPRLRGTGWIRKAGRTPMIIDRTREKEEILRRTAEETRQIEEARRRILTGEARRLSDFAAMDRHAFSLFLDCLGSALSRQPATGGAVETRSSDGTLLIRLERIAGAAPARLETEDGVFMGPDHWIHIGDILAGACQ